MHHIEFIRWYITLRMRSNRDQPSRIAIPDLNRQNHCCQRFHDDPRFDTQSRSVLPTQSNSQFTQSVRGRKRDVPVQQLCSGQKYS